MSFTGVIPALITPFSEDLSQVRTDLLVENAAGMEHVVVCGTMGEAGAMSFDERRAVIDAAVAAGLTVTVGVSAADGPTAARYAEQAADAGAHGLMCLPPTMYHADERELDAHYTTVCGATDLPVMLYNNPEATRQDLQPETIFRLAERHPTLLGVKECSGDARRIARIVALAGDRLQVLIGGDDWALEGYAAGAVGWVSGVANIAYDECVALERATLGGELETARAIWPRLLPLSRLDMDPKLVQWFKAALDLTGRHGGPTRPPRLPLTGEEMEIVRQAVGALGPVAVS
jgi:4-hydroxy-tetrahydrodipicolinate synthase